MATFPNAAGHHNSLGTDQTALFVSSNVLHATETNFDHIVRIQAECKARGLETPAMV